MKLTWLGLVPALLVAGLLMTSLTQAAEPKGENPKSIGSIETLDPAFEKLLATDQKIEVLGSGFDWSEGPCWIKKGGYLLFSDIPPNKIMKWDPKGGISLFREKVGYTGSTPFPGDEPGTNGLTLDSEGRLVMCCHGDRAVKRMEADEGVQRALKTEGLL